MTQQRKKIIYLFLSLILAFSGLLGTFSGVLGQTYNVRGDKTTIGGYATNDPATIADFDFTYDLKVRSGQRVTEIDDYRIDDRLALHRIQVMEPYTSALESITAYPVGSTTGTTIPLPSPMSGTVVIDGSLASTLDPIDAGAGSATTRQYGRYVFKFRGTGVQPTSNSGYIRMYFRLADPEHPYLGHPTPKADRCGLPFCNLSQSIFNDCPNASALNGPNPDPNVKVHQNVVCNWATFKSAAGNENVHGFVTLNDPIPTYKYQKVGDLTDVEKGSPTQATFSFKFQNMISTKDFTNMRFVAILPSDFTLVEMRTNNTAANSHMSTAAQETLSGGRKKYTLTFDTFSRGEIPSSTTELNFVVSFVPNTSITDTNPRTITGYLLMDDYTQITGTSGSYELRDAANELVARSVGNVGIYTTGTSGDNGDGKNQFKDAVSVTVAPSVPGTFTQINYFDTGFEKNKKITPGDNYTYRIEIMNDTATAASHAAVYEVLPTGLDAKSFKPQLSGPIQGTGTSNFTIQYCVSPTSPPSPTDPGTCSNWQGGASIDWPNVVAYRIDLNSPNTVPAGGATFQVTMETGNSDAEGFDIARHRIYYQEAALGTWKKNNVDLTVGVNPRVKITTKYVKQLPTDPDMGSATVSGLVTATGESLNKTLTYPPGATSVSDVVTYNGFSSAFARQTWRLTPGTDSVYTDLSTSGIPSATTANICEFGEDTPRNTTNTATHDYECTILYQIPPRVNNITFRTEKRWDPNVTTGRSGLQIELQYADQGQTNWARVPVSMLQTQIDQSCASTNPVALTGGGASNVESLYWCVPDGKTTSEKYDYRIVESEATPGALDRWTPSNGGIAPIDMSAAGEVKAFIENTFKVPMFTTTDPYNVKATWIEGGPTHPEIYLTVKRYTSSNSPACTVSTTEEIVTGYSVGNVPITDALRKLNDFTQPDWAIPGASDNPRKWIKTFPLTGLPKTDAYGCTYDYWIEATKLDGSDLAAADYANYTKVDGDRGSGNPDDEIIMTYIPETVRVTGTKKWVGGQNLSRPDVKLGVYVKDPNDPNKLILPHLHPNIVATPYYATCEPAASYPTGGIVTIRDGDNPGNTEDSVVWCLPLKDRLGNQITYYIDEELGNEYTGTASGTLPSGVDTLEKKLANYTKSFENATTVVNTYTPSVTNEGGVATDDGKAIATVIWRCGTTNCPATMAKSDVTLTLHRRWKSANGNCPDDTPPGTATCGTLDEGLTLTNRSITLANADAGTHSWTAAWPTGGETAVLPNTDPTTGMTYYYTVDATVADTNAWELVSVVNPTNGNAAPVVTFRYKVQNVVVQAKKVWVNGENSSEKAAALNNIRFTLKRRINGGSWQNATLIAGPEYTTTVGGLIPADPNGGEVKWLTPRTNANGEAYEFDVVETPTTIAGFEAVDVEKDPTGLIFTVTNTYKQPEGDINLTKQWINGANYPLQSGTTVTAKFTLQRSTDGVNYEDVTITSPSAGYAVSPDAELNQPGTSLKWKTELKDQTGKPYTFKVIETTPANFTSEEVPHAGQPYQFEFKNTFVPPVSEKVGGKIWDGGSELPRPAVTLTLQRKATGEANFTTVPVTELKAMDASCVMTNPVTISAVPWEVRWCAEDYNQAGSKYTYQITEAPVAGYTASPNGMSILNRFVVQSNTTFTGTVAWIGGSGHRPASVDLALKRIQVDDANADVPNTEETAFIADATADPASSWKATWNNLPDRHQATGRKYRYYVDTDWTHTDFDKVVSLVNQTVLTGPNTTDTVTFKYKGGGSLVGIKRWDGGWEDARFDVTLTLERCVQGTTNCELAWFSAGSSETAVVTLAKADAATHLWQKEWSDVIMTDPSGNPYDFRIIEDVPPAGVYFTEVSDSDPMMVTNKYVAPLYQDNDPATADGTYIGKKFWIPDNSVAAPSIEMQLYRQAYNPTVLGGTAVGSPETVGAAVNVTAADNWQHTFTGLVKYQESTGYEYKYWVDEVSVPADFAKVDSASDHSVQLVNNDATIYNKKIEPPNTVTLTKIWAGIPAGYTNTCEMTFRLLNDGALIEEDINGNQFPAGYNPLVVTGSSQTTFKWENLPAQTGAGYTITETLGANCDSFAAGAVNDITPTSFTVTNTYNSTPIPAIKATKIWKNGQTKRSEVKFTLHRRAGTIDEIVPDSELGTGTLPGSVVCQSTSTVTIIPMETTPSASATEKRPVYWCGVARETSSGTPYVYYVTEEFVNPGDESSWEKGTPSGNMTDTTGDGMSITNTFKPSKTTLALGKEWTRAIKTDPVTIHVFSLVLGSPNAPVPIGMKMLDSSMAHPSNPKLWLLPPFEVDAQDEKGQTLVYLVDEPLMAGCEPPTYDGNEATTYSIKVKNDCDYEKATVQVTVNWAGGVAAGTERAVTITFTNDKGLPQQTLDFPAGTPSGTMKQIQLDAFTTTGDAVTWRMTQSFNTPSEADDFNTTPAAMQDVPALVSGGTATMQVTNTLKNMVDTVTVQKEWVGGPTNKPATWFKLQRSTDNGATKEDVPGAAIKEVPAGTAAIVTVAWDNIDQKDPISGVYYKFYPIETDSSGNPTTVDGYDKAEAELKVTNTWNGKPGDITAEKEWTDTDPHPQIWFKLFRSTDGGTTKEDAGVPVQQVPAAAPFTVTWNNVPSADANGVDYTFYVQEVDSTGTEFSPAGYGKVESGLKVVNSKSGMLTIDLTTDPFTTLPFEINVTDGAALNHTEQIDNDAADTARDNIVHVNNVLPQAHTIRINGLDTNVWAVSAINCTERPLGSASGTGTDLAITREENGGELTGKFVIDNMPPTAIVECHYELQSRVGGQVFVSNETADNPPNPLPTYSYVTTGPGYVDFDVPANGAPNNQELLPGTYTVAQQNINGWVTMDVIVESSDPNRNPLVSWTDRPTSTPVPNGTGYESVVTFTVEPNERVNIRFINGPANSVFIRGINIPANAPQQFVIHGFADGIISPSRTIFKSGLIPNGNRWQLTQGEVDGWELIDITCVEHGQVGPLTTIVDVANRTVHIGLDPGEAISCIFTNHAIVDPEEIYDPPVPGFTDLDVLPRTGFAPGRVTNLIDQPAMKRYDTSPLRLTIPSMNVSLEVFGVPRTDGYWDVTWLGKNAGYIEGSAYPMQEGNSILTAHVWDEYNNPGPFFGLKDLKYGDRFTLTAYGKTYVYEVRESERIAETEVEQLMTAKESGIWTTLMTCEAYDEGTERYAYRRFVRAVLIEIQ